MAHDGWCRETYEESISSRCWWFTPYDAGWEGNRKYGGDLENDVELRAIVLMERRLGESPVWARALVDGAIRFVPPCGHASFPLGYLDAVDAIGRQSPPPLIHTCFTVDRARKERLLDYAFCLDAWLAGAQPDAAARELLARGEAGVDWSKVCDGLWQVLGERTETKELLVERLLHQLRWWLKSTVWDDDTGSQYCRDSYIGDYGVGGCLQDSNGNRGYDGPAYAQERSPRVQRMEARLAEICADWPWFRTVIVEFSWPCAPKAIRFLEKTLWCIGRERPVISLPSFPLTQPEEVPDYLACCDTYPNQEQASTWWDAFLAALDGWWREQPPDNDLARDIFARLGARSPVKRWLVRLLAHRLRMLERDSGSLGKLVRPRATSRRGSKSIDIYA